MRCSGHLSLLFLPSSVPAKNLFFESWSERPYYYVKGRVKKNSGTSWAGSATLEIHFELDFGAKKRNTKIGSKKILISK